jgi:hypothetical protein
MKRESGDWDKASQKFDAREGLRHGRDLYVTVRDSKGVLVPAQR